FYCMGERIGLTRENTGAIGFEPGEKHWIAKRTIFDDLRIAGPELAGRQGFERPEVCQYERRLVKGADQILAMTGVNASFAANGGVDLCEKRGRYLHEADAAFDASRGKTGQVASHAAAEGNDGMFPLNTKIKKRAADTLESGKALRALAGRHKADLTE